MCQVLFLISDPHACPRVRARACVHGGGGGGVRFTKLLILSSGSANSPSGNWGNSVNWGNCVNSHIGQFPRGELGELGDSGFWVFLGLGDL